MPARKTPESTALVPAEEWAKRTSAILGNTGQLTLKSLSQIFADCQANTLAWAGFTKADTTAKCGPTLRAAFGKGLDKLSRDDISFVRQAYASPRVKDMIRMLNGAERNMVLRMLVGIRREQQSKKN